jgi:cytochrome c oxidase subunit 2
MGVLLMRAATIFPGRQGDRRVARGLEAARALRLTIGSGRAKGRPPAFSRGNTGRIMRALLTAFSGLCASLLCGATRAQSGQPVDGGIGMLPAASKLAEEAHFFHNAILMPIITVISLFVLGLLLWIIARYNAKANPTPRKFSHNTMLEVVWTGIPILILLFIAIPSFDLLYKEDIVPDGKAYRFDGDGVGAAFKVSNDFPESRMARRGAHVQAFLSSPAGERRLKKGEYRISGLGKPQMEIALETAPARGETLVVHVGRSLIGRGGFFGGSENQEIALAPTLTLKVTGRQWYWQYAYPDFGEDLEFNSNMLPRDRVEEDFYHFEVDNRAIVPVGETIRVTTTAADVIHAFALPNFAIKIDAVPGRINEIWFKADREGVYYGQCSEICGVKHAFMPIAVEVVSREAFCAWVASKQAEFGVERGPEVKAREPLCGALVGNAALAQAGAAAPAVN